MLHRILVLVAATAILPACRGAVDGQNNGGVDSGQNPLTDMNLGGNNGNNFNQTTETNANGQTSNADPGDMGTSEDASETPFDAGPCGASGFGDEFSVTPISATSASGNLHAVPTEQGGAIVGWQEGQQIHITHVDGTGAEVSDTTVDGNALYGLATNGDARAVMVSRGTDVLALAIVDGAGGTIYDDTIIGDVPHDVTNNEWFGSQIRAGRLIWTGSQWATYFTVQRLWDDGVAHYGDQLRLYEPDGSSSQTVWGWGCSHSMEVRISHNGDRLGPVCSSDCYPSKGVHFNHRGGQLWPDESGSNCAGGYGTSLGASVPVPGGFWVAFTATDERDSHDVAIVKIDDTTPGDPIWLTEDATRDAALNAVSFEEDLLVAWDAGGTNQFVITDGSTGEVVNGPVSIADADLGSSSDFFQFSNGDVGWVQNAGGSVGLARLRACR
jgi:hypothetical protein